jgi:1-deoxy-D-xylulose-5-phosphate reductoisomerase
LEKNNMSFDHASAQKGMTILGSTGSIGRSTLDVIHLHPERFKIVALCARKDHKTLLEQCKKFTPEFAVLVDREAAEALRHSLKSEGLNTVVLCGRSALVEMACHPDVQIVMAAIVGAAGLPPTLAAAQAGKRVLLANKEALVMSGPLFMDAVEDSGAKLLPVDSEHNAIFQSLPVDFSEGLAASGVARILLTASGGPFRDRDPSTLNLVTPDEACKHPNWVMGRKISVDSATMMNKGLEMIEACWLFHAQPEQVEIVIHPQSVVHSLVEYVDGSVLAQLGNADMRTPIAHALAWPDRIHSGVERLDLIKAGRLEFHAPDELRFPCIRLAYSAMRQGGTAPAILNAANELAVEAFLQERILFTQISSLVESCLEAIRVTAADSLEAIFDADSRAREWTEAWLKAKAH